MKTINKTIVFAIIACVLVIWLGIKYNSYADNKMATEVAISNYATSINRYSMDMSEAIHNKMFNIHKDMDSTLFSNSARVQEDYRQLQTSKNVTDEQKNRINLLTVLMQKQMIRSVLLITTSDMSER